MDRLRNTTQLSSQEILAALSNHKAVLAEMGVRKIGLFGSYRRGTPRKDSDIDFLVVLSRPTFDRYISIKFYLEDLFGHKVDLVMEDSIKPRIRSYILDEVIYAQGY